MLTDWWGGASQGESLTCEHHMSTSSHFFWTGNSPQQMLVCCCTYQVKGWEGLGSKQSQSLLALFVDVAAFHYKRLLEMFKLYNLDRSTKKIGSHTQLTHICNIIEIEILLNNFLFSLFLGNVWITASILATAETLWLRHTKFCEWEWRVCVSVFVCVCVCVWGNRNVGGGQSLTRE